MSLNAVPIIDERPIYINDYNCPLPIFRYLKPQEAVWLSQRGYLERFGNGTYLLDNNSAIKYAASKLPEIFHDYEGEYEKSLCFANEDTKFFSVNLGSKDKIDKYFYNEKILEGLIFDGIEEKLATDKINLSLDTQKFIQRLRILVKVENDTSFILRPASWGENDDSLALPSYDNPQKYAYSQINVILKDNRIHFFFSGSLFDEQQPSAPTFSRATGNREFPSTINMRQWVYVKPTNPQSEYILATLYFANNDIKEELNLSSNIMVEFKEASFKNGVISVNNALSVYEKIYLNADDYTMKQWVKSNLLLLDDDKSLYGTHKEAKDIENNSQVLLFQQTAFPTEKGIEHHEDRRCIEEYIEAIRTLGVSVFERIWGAPSVCDIHSEPNLLPIIPIVEEQITSLPDTVTINDAENVGLGPDNEDDFDTAMGALAFGDNIHSNENEGRSTAEERSAARAIGDLSNRVISSLLREVRDYNNDAAAGAAAALNVHSGDSELDRFINANPSEAEALLNTAILITNTSDSRDYISQPVSLRKRKNEKRKKGVVAARCTQQPPEHDATGWTCVTKAKRKLKKTEPTIAVPSNIQRGGVYYTRNRQPNDFEALAIEMRVSGLGFPPGYSQQDMLTNVWAYARDGAITGQNRNIIYLPDAQHGSQQQRRTMRFRYGLSHIFTDNEGGHKKDWAALGIRTRDHLANMIMSAVTSTVAPTIYTRDQTRQRREYSYVTYTYQGQVHTITNVVIVVGANGMIITAYPTNKSKKS